MDHEQVWTSLYASGRTPWDTGRPASQLVEYTAAVDVSGLRAVELGCGTGASCVHLAVRGCSLVVGVDIAAPAVAAAKARAEAAGVSERCVFVRADALTLRPETLLALVAIRYGNAFDNFDLCFDCRGLQVLWAAAPDRAGSGLARLLAPGATVLTVSGNANEYRAYTGSETALTCAEIVGALAPPAFDLLSLRETHFDAGWQRSQRRQRQPAACVARCLRAWHRRCHAGRHRRTAAEPRRGSVASERWPRAAGGKHGGCAGAAACCCAHRWCNN